jgi:hypothetical protein
MLLFVPVLILGQLVLELLAWTYDWVRSVLHWRRQRHAPPPFNRRKPWESRLTRWLRRLEQ